MDALIGATAMVNEMTLRRSTKAFCEAGFDVGGVLTVTAVYPAALAQVRALSKAARVRQTVTDHLSPMTVNTFCAVAASW